MQTKQTTRDDIQHDKKSRATGQSQAQQVQERQPSKARRQFTTNLLHPSESKSNKEKDDKVLKNNKNPESEERKVRPIKK